MMEGTRRRFVALVEWVAAAACVLAVLVAVDGVTRQLRIVRPVVAVIAEEAEAPIVPASMRPGAIAVPEVVLPDGKRLVRGEAAATLDILGPHAQSGPSAFERQDGGQRESRVYRYAGLEFVVVIAEDKIVAIYR